jgi:Tol biopolymer transport system component
MIESPEQPPEKREALAALHIYEPVPTNKIFPVWEWTLKFGWIGAVALAGAVGYCFWKPEAVKPVVPVLHFAPVSQWTSDSGFNLAPAISNDGKLVAYASDRDGSGGLAIWIRPFDSGKPLRLTSGEFNETDPDFSPDGRLIAYRSERDGGGVYIQSTASGAAPKLAAKNGWKPRFSPDGKWIAYFTLSASEDVSDTMGLSQIFIVPAEGGTPRRIQPSFPYARYPIWAPDSRRLLFTGIRQDGVRDWWLSSIEGGEASRTHALEWVHRSLKTVSYPDQWQGESIYFSGAEDGDAHVWALPISPSTMQVTGPPRRLTDGKDQEQQIAIGAGGRLLFARLHMSSDIWSLPLEANQAKALGKLKPLTRDAAKAQLPALSADGSKMVYVSDKSGVRDVWVRDLNGKADEAVTTFRTIGYRPLLSPDGKQLVFPVFQNKKCTVTLLDLGPPGRLTELKGCFSIWDWSPDGSSLLTFQPGLTKTVDLMKISTGRRQPVLLPRSGNLFGARFSPDGRWIAFAAGASGAGAKVFIAPLRSSPPPEREWIAVSPDTGGDPAWSPDGNVLYFRSKRDGFYCIWAQRLGSGKAPIGEPIGVLHLHSSLGLTFLRSTDLGIAVTRDRLTLNLGRMTGNLWTMDLPRNRQPQVMALVPDGRSVHPD